MTATAIVDIRTATQRTTGPAVPEPDRSAFISSDIDGASISIRMNLGVTLATLACAGGTLETPTVKPERIRGEPVALDGDALKVHRRSGQTVSIEVKPAVTVSAVRAINPSGIRPGSVVGTAAMTGANGKLTATEVLLFPEVAPRHG